MLLFLVPTLLRGNVVLVVWVWMLFVRRPTSDVRRPTSDVRRPTARGLLIDPAGSAVAVNPGSPRWAINGGQLRWAKSGMDIVGGDFVGAR